MSGVSDACFLTLHSLGMGMGIGSVPSTENVGRASEALIGTTRTGSSFDPGSRLVPFQKRSYEAANDEIGFSSPHHTEHREQKRATVLYTPWWSVHEKEKNGYPDHKLDDSCRFNALAGAHIAQGKGRPAC